jgi:hypothetical protein
MTILWDSGGHESTPSGTSPHTDAGQLREGCAGVKLDRSCCVEN